MTNLTATLLLVLATNWTGIQSNQKELGYVVTNHVAQIIYLGKTNEFWIKTTESNLAVWRGVVWQTNGFLTVTNFAYPRWYPGYGKY